jgi:hypothetical protein
MDGALRPPPHDQGQSPIRPRLTRMLQPLRTPTGEPNEFVREIHTRNAGHSARKATRRLVIGRSQ